MSTRVYERVDRPLVAAIGRMERRGVKVDRDYLAKLSARVRDRDRRARRANLRSRVRAVHHRLARSNWARCCTGGSASRAGARARAAQYSTDVNELERLAGEGVECARLVLEWRQLTKLKSTYTDALQAQINPETGRVHTSFCLSGAQTGRLSLERPQFAEHPDPHRDRAQDPRRLRRRAGPCPDERRLQPDRASPGRAHGRRAAAEGGVPRRAPTSTT